MRRLRPIRRRDRQREIEDMPPPDSEMADEDEASFEPFVPVPAQHEPGDDDDTESAYPEIPSRRRLRLPHVPRLRLSRPRTGITIRFGVLMLAVALIAGGIFGTLINQDRLNPDIESWWPAVVIAGAIVWMLAALLQRRVTSLLGGAALGGVGLSLLMDVQDIAAFQETLLGVVLITVGLGIVIRGFLLRQQTPA